MSLNAPQGISFANKVTIGRILAVPFFTVALLYYAPSRIYLWWTALGLFSLAVISDVIDGYIARTRNQKTKAGAILDPLADKMLLISAFICLHRVGALLGNIQLPLWVVLAVISRDVILLSGAMIIHLVHGKLDITPSYWGKASTFFQIFSIFGIFFQWSFSLYIWWAAVVLTIISGLDYIKKGIKVLNAPG